MTIDFNTLVGGYTLHHDVNRVEAPIYIRPEALNFPDPISAAIDEDRRMLFGAEKTAHARDQILSLAYLPPILI